MSAVKALTQARAAGIHLGIDGDDLVLNASAPPPSEVLEILARHKADIVTLLDLDSDAWSGEDWWDYFEERAAVAEHCGRMTR